MQGHAPIESSYLPICEEIGCPLETVGDTVALLAFDLPERSLVEQSQLFKYEDLLTMEQAELAQHMRDKIVFVGLDIESEVKTVRFRLSSDQRFGVELHAYALDALLKGRVRAVAVPDVRGRRLADAVGTLRSQGLLPQRGGLDRGPRYQGHDLLPRIENGDQWSFQG